MPQVLNAIRWRTQGKRVLLRAMRPRERTGSPPATTAHMSVTNDAARLARVRLDAITAQHAFLTDMEHIVVRTARLAGLSWSEIGKALGITRQAAYARYGEKDDPDE